ncbi:MAG TPA: cyclic nucleotide-binding domain-containing protein [Kofleriaceae bacterium]|nr:cyclic nucleotide-binding domain-containing protein [Kofleriaceae bacterium]
MSTDDPAPDSPAAALGRAAHRLTRVPNDLGAWWELCAALFAAGRRPEAVAAYASLGRAASLLGHPALAVACARALADAGEEASGARLIEHVAREHGSGASKVDRSLRSSPPAPPPSEPTSPGAQPDAPTEIDAAVALADRAVRAAAASATARAPEALAPTPLIGVLEVAAVRDLCSVMRLRLFEPDDVIVDVGDPASALYWIARGAAEVSRDGQHLGELRPNQFFGEIALVGGTTRTARVTAFGPAVLLEIPAQEVEAMAARAPLLAQVLAHYARTRLLASVMRMSELFSRLSEEEHQKLLPLFDTEMFEPGDAVVESGSQNERLYVIASGSCQVKNGDQVMAVLSPGDGIGEMSLLARRPANFDVVAIERTVALSLSREKFDAVAVDHPTLLAEVYKLLVQRENENLALVHDANDLVV